MILSFKKSTAIILFFVLLGTLGLASAVKHTNASTVYFGGTTKKLPIYSVGRTDNKISISFDCAYGAEYTQGILDVLNEYDVKCTFFVVDFWAKKYPDVLKAIVENGHEIGTHSTTHPKMSKLSTTEIKEELTTSINTITELTGQKVELFRAPFGDYDNDVLTIAEGMGLYTIQWDVDSIDWKDISAKQITSRVVNKTKSGSIILCHNNGLHTLEALPYVLSNLKEKGYEFVKISELIYKENYEINSFGVQTIK